jgi:hypothetical protein
MMISTMQELANIPDLKAVIINQAVVNTNAAVYEFRKLRNDVFIVYCSPSEPLDDVKAFADLILSQSDMISGEAVVMQAKAMGAEEFIFYTFARHMDNGSIRLQRDVMRATAEREGLGFIEINTPDPMVDSSTEELDDFLAADIKEHVERFGENIAFYGTGCGMQVAMLNSIVETGAIYPRPCCPSPYHAFTSALNIAETITTDIYDETSEAIVIYRAPVDVIADTRTMLRGRGVEGRISNWATPVSMLWTNVGVEYAIAFINGQASQQPGVIDLELISALAEDYIYRVSGESTGVSFSFMEQDGYIFYNHIVGIINNFTY